jgi:hypothetical protein
MITLTNPIAVKTTLGGTTTVNYDKLVLSPFVMTPHPTNRRVAGDVKLSSTANSQKPDIIGNFKIDLATGVLEIEVERVQFYERIVLTAGQITAVQNIINNAQNALEQGLINVGVVAGIQSVGA